MNKVFGINDKENNASLDATFDETLNKPPVSHHLGFGELGFFIVQVGCIILYGFCTEMDPATANLKIENTIDPNVNYDPDRDYVQNIYPFF